MSLQGTCALQATSHVSEVQLQGLSTSHGATALQDITFHGAYHIPWRAVQPLPGTISPHLLDSSCSFCCLWVFLFVCFFAKTSRRVKVIPEGPQMWQGCHCRGGPGAATLHGPGIQSSSISLPKPSGSCCFREITQLCLAQIRVPKAPSGQQAAREKPAAGTAHSRAAQGCTGTQHGR